MSTPEERRKWDARATALLLESERLAADSIRLSDRGFHRSAHALSLRSALAFDSARFFLDRLAAEEVCT